ncbi:unnamed protein product [Symbiodinium natans]|uniref:Photosynthesis system II assembly factor Ycf48/Hcf136-like domain-containing protein n=1 Tax=Symbiodinium natans TaxID=878477 RepID=A0A812IAD7_9DINO|nr:unnamed protein product [Symbiodinium natans]
MYSILLPLLTATTRAAWVEDTFFTGQQPSWRKFAMTSDGSTIAGAGHMSYWFSTDSGATWTRRSPLDGKYEGIALSADGSKLVAAGIEIQMWKSEGTLASSIADANFPSAVQQKLRDLAMSPDGNIIVTAGDTSDVDAQTWTQGSFRSTDFGATWNQISTTPMTGIAMSADGNVIAAVTSQSNAGVRVSTDGGANWATNTPSESTSLIGIAMSSSGSIMAAVGHGNNAGIWISNNTGSTWTQVVSDSGVWDSVSMSADGSVMGATKMSSKLWTSSDFGVTWAEDATSPDNAKFIAISSDGTKMVMEGAGKVQLKGFATPTTTTTTTTTTAAATTTTATTTTSGAGNGGSGSTQGANGSTSASHRAALIGASCMAGLAILG